MTVNLSEQVKEANRWDIYVLSTLEVSGVIRSTLESPFSPSEGTSNSGMSHKRY